MKYQRLQDLREDHDLTKTQMGEVLHVDRRTYSYYETGDRKLTAETLAVIARYYNTSVDYLLDLTDEKKPYPPKKNRRRTTPDTESGK